MISPEYYRKTIENYDLIQLRQLRDELLAEISRFEKDEISLEEKMIAPSPDVVYQCNNDYLVQVIELINQKFNASLYDEDYEELN